MPESKSRGHVVINTEECKGCELCIEACPANVLVLSEKFNTHGYHTSSYVGTGCTGCGICFYACPEPGAISVFKRWDLITETALCPNCGVVHKVFRSDNQPEERICTNCLKPVPETEVSLL
jgi:2-oxoglutarate ferredoxin oxidoreductase subunit delta